MEKLKRLPSLGVYSLVAYMPFHLFLSRWLSQYTNGLGQWDVAKDLFTVMILLVSLFLFLQQKLYKNPIINYIMLLSVAYLIVHILFIIFDWNNFNNRPFVIGTLYNGRIFAWLFIGLIAGVVDRNFSIRTLIKVLLIASTLTCIFAFIQYVAPKNLMEYFGYSIERGAKPSFHIDDKADFPRVMSTIRDPNSYGAYLILPIIILWVGLLKQSLSRLKLIGLLGLHAIALFLTFSRGAWLGALLALGVTTTYLYKRKVYYFARKHYPILIVGIVILLSFTFIFKNTYVFKNLILHADESTVLSDPNELRIHLQSKAVERIIDHPQGHGPGTAGLASIGNPKGTFLTENYYLQIGYEVGVLGALIFIAMLAIVFFCLKSIKSLEQRAVFIGCFAAYIIIGMLIHLWSNEAVAAQWWLVVGAILGISTRDARAKK